MNKLTSYYWAYRNKVSNKIFGRAFLPAQGQKKGSILLSYLTEPFTKTPGENLSTYHSSYWECYEIARLFAFRGYSVDIIQWSNTTFIPRKKYILCIDTQKNLERLAQYLEPHCIKVMHIVASYPEFQNKAEQKRINEINNKHQTHLLPHRTEASSKNIEIADIVEGFGNKTTFNTYNFAKKTITSIPPSPAVVFEIDKKISPEIKNKFLFLGGGGMALKGLDRVLEAFVQIPENTLTVCGPVESETDFFSAFKKELTETKNIVYKGRIDQGVPLFKEIVSNVIAMIYPTASEGCAGAVITSLHAGLIVVTTRNSGIDADLCGGLVLENSSVEEIKETIRKINSMSMDELELRSKTAQEYARKNFTKETFSKAYDIFITNQLHL